MMVLASRTRVLGLGQRQRAIGLWVDLFAVQLRCQTPARGA